MTEHRIIQGDVLDGLRSLPDGCVQCCVTSPPYWGLRDYGVDGQIGLEKTPEEYVKIIKERLQAHSQLDTGVIQYRFEKVPA